MNDSDSNSSEPSGQYYVRYKIGDDEIEASAPTPEFVNQHAAAFMRVKSDQPIQMRLPDFVENENAPLLADNGASIETTGNKFVDVQNLDLLSFYRKKGPKSQPEQVVVVCFYLQKYDAFEVVTASDVGERLLELRRVNAKQIKNVNLAMIAAERREFLYRPDPNAAAFALTVKGEEFVENMTNGSEMEGVRNDE